MLDSASEIIHSKINRKRRNEKRFLNESIDVEIEENSLRKIKANIFKEEQISDSYSKIIKKDCLSEIISYSD